MRRVAVRGALGRRRSGGAARRAGRRCRPGARPGHRTEWADGQPNMKNAEPVLLAPLRVLLVDRYAATDFFAAFGCGFDAGFGAVLFAALPFSFAANSCLTVAEMASTSTL